MVCYNVLGGIYGTESDDWRHILRFEAVARPYRWNKIPNRGGRTLVNGTGYDIKLKSEETWLLNTNPKWEGIKKYNINFISNGEAFIEITMDFVLRYIQPNGDSVTVYSENGGWGNTTYRTITFDEEPTGDLLTWLEANGTRV
nr:MAG TPA: hypothetical protein [Caudoviricetes sp.]